MCLAARRRRPAAAPSVLNHFLRRFLRRLCGEVLVEPFEHRRVRLGGGVGVVARTGVVEEGVVDALERAHLVRQPGGLERRLGRVA